MIQNVLSHIGGIGVHGVLSICLSFGLFLSVVIWALRLKQPYLDSVGSLPLEGDVPPASHCEPISTPENSHE